MHRTNKWRIGVAVCEYYMVDVESWSEADAIELAYQKIENIPDDLLMTTTTNVTSIYLNDTDSRGFVPFVAEYIGDNEELEGFL
jgi:hypothetical protein